MKGPVLPEVGVIGLVPDVWGSLGVPWMPRQHVLTRLAHYFHVVWMDPPHGWREWWLPRRRAGIAAIEAGPPVEPGFHLYRPGRWAPAAYRPHTAARRLERARLAHARRILRRAGARRLVLYLWRPEFAFALDGVAHDLSCYHIDDEYSFSPVERGLDAAEAALIRRVDEVFIHSPALLEKKGELNPHTEFVPNGVDYAAHAAPRVEPDDLRAVPRPRAGYVGVLKEQLDWPLLEDLAARRPDWSFVLVGPSRLAGEDAARYDALRQRPNVHVLGVKPAAAVPAYLQHLDAALLCYRMDNYTKYIYPLKLHECLAAGCPVLGSPLPSLMAFAEVVQLARTPAEWAAALDACALPPAWSREAVARRRAVAQAHDWNRLVERIAQKICERLGMVMSPAATAPEAHR